jgi:ATP-dependent helicase/nuclease subunit A
MVINDSLQRRQALNPTESYIVSAPAGSGKTGLLTQRYLKLLSTVRFPEEVLAITFTQKAASEMSRRIYECLEFAANNPRPESEFSAVNYDLAMDVLERSQKSGWQLLDMPNRLRVRTIDSFSRYIATQFSIEAGMLDVSNPSENPEPMYLESARSIITKLEDKNDPLHESIKTLVRLTGNNLNNLEKLLAEMLPTREQWLPIIYSAANNADYFTSVINNLIETRLESTEEKLLPIIGELVALTDYAAQNVDADKNPNLASLIGIQDSPTSTAQDAHIWKILASMLVTDKGTYRKSITKTLGFPTTGKEEKARMLELVDYCTSIDGLEEALASLKDLPNPTLDVEQKETLNALAEVLPALAAELNIVFTKYNTCDFASITLSALNAMKQNDDNISDITMRLDYNLKHILIDEFQDTSSAQIQLVASLVEGWIPGDGRTLFIVGDAMQSLYSFRNANVSLFANAQRYPIGPIQCTHLALSTNFRSQQGIVDWVNTSFTKAFPLETDVNRGGIPYSPATSIKQNTQEKSVNFVGFTGNGYEEAEAKVVADTCKTIIDKNPGDSIAILIKSRSHLKQIIPQLLKNKLHWDALNIDPLESRMPVQDILSLTKALSSVADRISWLALLRAPTVGLTLDDIIKITNSTEQDKYSGDAVLEQLISANNNEHNVDISPRGRQILDRVVPILIQGYQQAGRKNLRHLVEKTWLDLGGAHTLNENDNKDVRQTLELIEKHEEAAKIRDWSNFELAIKKLFGQPSSDTDNNDTPPIQIMTIHASKGLEFDHVILPGLSRTSGKSSKTLMQWHLSSNDQNKNSLLIAPAGAHDSEESDLYEYLRKEKSAREILEQTRLMYVATTRAVKSLTMTAKLKPKGESFEKPANSLSIARIWPGLIDDLEAGAYDVIETGGAETEHESTVAPSLRLKALPHEFSKDALKIPTKAPGNGIKPYSINTDKKARGLGTVKHSWIQQICMRGVEWFNALSVDVFKRMTAMKLKEIGIMATSEDVDMVYQVILGMTKDQDTKNLMLKITDVEVEIGARATGEDSTQKLIVDASYIDEFGTRVIIDWKTSSPRKGESEAEFFSREVERYREKMIEYAGAYRKIDAERAKIKAKLFFVKSRKLAAIEI